MHIHFLDPYHPKKSPIHELDPRVKFVLAVAFIFVTALTPLGSWPVYVLLFAIVLSVEMLSDLGVGYVLKRSALAIPFMLTAFPLLFTVEGTQFFTLPIGDGISASLEGLERFLSIAIRSWISVQMAIVLAASTSFPDLLIAMRAVKMPRLIVAVLGLMWRYLFVLADEVIRLLRARAARSAKSSEPNQKSGGSLVWRARVTGGMAGSLFLRSFERGDRIYAAMIARGYDGEIRAFSLPPISLNQRIVLFCGLAVLVLLLFLSFLFA